MIYFVEFLYELLVSADEYFQYLNINPKNFQSQNIPRICNPLEYPILEFRMQPRHIPRIINFRIIFKYPTHPQNILKISNSKIPLESNRRFKNDIYIQKYLKNSKIYYIHRKKIPNINLHHIKIPSISIREIYIFHKYELNIHPSNID